MNSQNWVTWGLVMSVAAACSDGSHRLGGEYPEATGGETTSGETTGGETTGGATTGGATTGGRSNTGGGDALWAAGVAGDGPLPSPEEDVSQTQLMADERLAGQQALPTSDAEGQAMAWATPTGIHAAVSNSSIDPQANWLVPFEEPIATSTQPGVLKLVGLGRSKTESVHVLYLERDEEAEVDRAVQMMTRHHDYFVNPEGFDPAVELSRLGEGELDWPEVTYALAANGVGTAAWFDAAAGGCRDDERGSMRGSGWLAPEVVAELGESCGSELMLSTNDNARGVLALADAGIGGGPRSVFRGEQLCLGLGTAGARRFQVRRRSSGRRRWRLPVGLAPGRGGRFSSEATRRATVGAALRWSRDGRDRGIRVIGSGRDRRCARTSATRGATLTPLAFAPVWAGAHRNRFPGDNRWLPSTPISTETRYC